MSIGGVEVLHDLGELIGVFYIVHQLLHVLYIRWHYNLFRWVDDAVLGQGEILRCCLPGYLQLHLSIFLLPLSLVVVIRCVLEVHSLGRARPHHIY